MIEHAGFKIERAEFGSIRAYAEYICRKSEAPS